MTEDASSALPTSPNPVVPTPAERPVGEILAQLWQNFETAVRQELKLASAKLDEKSTQLKREGIAAVVAGAVLYAGILALIAALILLLANAVAPWLAALMVGAVVSAAGYVLLRRLAHDTATDPKNDTSSSDDISAFSQETP